MRIASSYAVLIALAAAPCSAQDGALVTDRPDFTESALSVLPGVVQVEAGYTWTRNDGVDVHSLGEVLLRIGVLPRAEVRVGLNSFAWSDGPSNASGMEDASLGVKVELTPGSNQGFQLLRPSIALLVSTTLPTGAEEFGETELQPAATLAMSWDLSERLGLGANAGVGAPTLDGDRFGQFSGSLALGASVTEHLGAYGEYYVFAPPGPDAEAAGFLNGGLTWLLGEDFQLDLRAGFGVHGDDADAFFFGGGLATRF
jgi:hypothetical protein